MPKKRARAIFYTTVHINEGYKAPLFEEFDAPLFSYGRYRTKIFAADLPEWYVEGRFCSQWAYVSAKGVKHLIYKPRYRDRSYKDDRLFISYDKPIIPEEDGFTSHDIVIYGIFIISFIEAVAMFSDIDVGDMQAQIAEKGKWNKQLSTTERMFNMLASDEIFEKFENTVKNIHFDVHAVYEPDGSEIFGDCYLAAVDLFTPGATYKVWFKTNDDGTIHVEHLERWWFG